MADRRRVVDAHVHFWDPSVLHYPWLDADPLLNRAFLPGDLESLSDRTINAVVFVEANCVPSESLEEAHFIETLAGTEPRIAGIVAYADLLDDAGRADALDALARRNRVVGVRHNIQGHEPGFCLHPSFVRGVREAATHGFTFDLCITADQLPDATRLVRECPDTQFILDHCGKPAIRADRLDDWAMGIACLAECDNVVCKVSGLLTESRADQRKPEALLPYLEHARACFGASRLLYGSDWPVHTIAGSATTWRGVVDGFTASWPEQEQDAFYARNATRIYRLEA